MKAVFFAVLSVCAVFGGETVARADMRPQTVAVLQALDKVTARVTEMQIPVGGAARFGSLRIDVEACYKSAPEDNPEAAAFLVIHETKSTQSTKSTGGMQFGGWVYASSPGLSTMEHPVYAVWALDCKN